MSNITFPFNRSTLYIKANILTKDAKKIFSQDPLSFGLCSKRGCLCDDKQECIGATVSSHTIDFSCGLDDIVNLSPLNTAEEVKECTDAINSRFASSIEKCTESQRLIWSLKAAGMKVDGNVLYLSKQEKEELVCEFMGWDMTVENLFDGIEQINGMDIIEFGYHPEGGLFGWDGWPLT